MGGTGYSVRAEAPVPKKKKVPQDSYSITMCRTRAKSSVTVTVARPLGWGICIRSTDTVSRVRHRPSIPGGEILGLSGCCYAHLGKSRREGHWHAGVARVGSSGLGLRAKPLGMGFGLKV